jgi:hypothetical protein
VKPNIRFAPGQPTTVDIHVIHLPRGVKTPLSEDWADPQQYDITISKKGQKLDTEYSVQPSPHKPVPAEATAALDAVQIDLAALFRNEDPFKGPAHAQVASNGNDDKIAGSKPNDFKDFGEQ